MGIPEPGTKKYEDMIDFIRKDIDSGMQYTKMIDAVRGLFERTGRNFEEEFAKFKKERRAR